MRRNGTWQISFLFRWFKAFASLRRLEVGRLVHEQSIQVVANLMSLWVVAWWTHMKNVGVLKMLGKRSSRYQLQMWSLLGCHHHRTCEMQARAKGIGVILANLQLEGMHPISVMFMGVLNTCAGVVPLGEGSYADEQVIECGWNSGAFVGNILVYVCKLWVHWVGKCPNRCHLEKWSLGPPQYWDMWNVGKGRRHRFAILTNTTWGCATKLHYIHGSAELVCHCSCQ